MLLDCNKRFSHQKYSVFAFDLNFERGKIFDLRKVVFKNEPCFCYSFTRYFFIIKDIFILNY